MLTVSDAEKLVHAFMTSRLDYCNALLAGCPASSINKLKIVQNAAARILTRSRKYDHITPILQSLHWQPIKFRISYKILLLSYKALNDLAPAYLTNLLSRYNPTRSLRSQNSGLLVVPRIAKSTKGGRTLSAESRTHRWAPETDLQWGTRHLDSHREKTPGTSGPLTLWLCCSWTNYWFVWPERNWPPDWAWFLPRFFLHSVTDGVLVSCRCRLWHA